MKKALSLLLALLTVFSVLTVFVSAAATTPLIVADLLKHDADAGTNVCRTVEIFIQRQFSHYDSAKQITFRTADDQIVAVCEPYADNICKFDLYTPGGDFGVVLDPSRLYYLTIPEGAYYTDSGVLCAAYRGEYNGVYLSDNDTVYSVVDLGISAFLATNAADGRLYAGKIRISAAFDSFRAANKAVTLLRKTGVNQKTGKEAYEVVGTYAVTAFRKGSADVAFGGVEIDRYASYKLHVDFGTFTSGQTTVNDRSEYVLSGKKLLGLREDYPVIDLLVNWFGADHRIVRAIVTTLNVLSEIKLVDPALAKDVKDYVNAKKSA